MKVALTALVLCFVCAPVEAQTEKDTKKTPSKGHTVSKDNSGKKTDLERRRVQSQRNDPWQPQDQRAKEAGAPPNPKGETVSPSSQPPKGPPSKAAQMQRDQYEKRQEGQNIPSENQVVQCRARPVCGGSYARCQPVARTYKSATVQASRSDIIQRCMQANTPDSCNCAAQCDAVAQCSIF